MRCWLGSVRISSFSRHLSFGSFEGAELIRAAFGDDVVEDRRIKWLIEFHPGLTLFDPAHLGVQGADLSDTKRDCVPYFQSPDDIVELAPVFG